MNTPKLATLVAGALLTLTAAPAARAQTPAVTIQTLPGAGFSAIPTAINNHGNVTGVVQLGDGSLHAALWRNGSMTDLSLSCPACGTTAIAYDINDHDQVVGYGLMGSAATPFVVIDGVMRPLPLPAGYDLVGIAFKITNAGRIVGYAAGASGTVGILWPSPTAAPQTLSIMAEGANDAGDIAGSVLNGCGTNRAAVLRGGTVTVLDPGDACEDGFGAANDVNQAGIVAGYILGGTPGQRAASWKGVVRTVYEPLPGFVESATGQKPVNDEGDIIGNSTDYSVSCYSRGTAWLPEGTLALPAPTPAADGCELSVAFAINRYAQAVGVTTGVDGHFVATVWNIGVDRRPPAITAVAGDDTIAPPSGKMVPVTFTGTITDETAIASASYSVTDEYGLVQPAGALTVNAAGQYSVTVLLEARRNGPDRDGRTYTFIATASDPAGRTSSASATAAVRVGKPAR
jgi:probable HAF family extracellular repeat protein